MAQQEMLAVSESKRQGLLLLGLNKKKKLKTDEETCSAPNAKVTRSQRWSEESTEIDSSPESETRLELRQRQCWLKQLAQNVWAASNLAQSSAYLFLQTGLQCHICTSAASMNFCRIPHSWLIKIVFTYVAAANRTVALCFLSHPKWMEEWQGLNVQHFCTTLLRCFHSASLV